MAKVAGAGGVPAADAYGSPLDQALRSTGSSLGATHAMPGARHARGDGDQAEHQPAPDQAGEGPAGSPAPYDPRRIQQYGERDFTGTMVPGRSSKAGRASPGPSRTVRCTTTFEPGECLAPRQQLDVVPDFSPAHFNTMLYTSTGITNGSAPT
jgi:hypothetical protein